MKDYIDKLREDYHRKKVSKFFLGGSKRVKANPPPSFIEDDPSWGPIDPNANKKPAYTEPAENDWSQGANYQALGLEEKPDDKITLNTQDRAAFEKVAPGVLSPEITPTVTSNPPPSFIEDDPSWGPIDPNANKKPAYTEPAENDWSYAYTEKGIQDAKDLGIEVKDSDKITLTPDQKKEFDENEKDFQEERKKRLEEEARKKMQGDPSKQQGFFLPPQGDLTTNLYNLGRAIGAKKGTKGRGLAIAGNTGAAALEASRALFSGMGFSKAQQYTDQYNQEQMIAARKKYESNPQYKNANYMGGPTQTRSGGTIRIYEDGGEQQMDPRMEQMMAQQQEQVDPRMQQQMDPRMAEQQQQQQQMDPRMQQQQESQMNQQETQAYQQIAEKLVNSFETIEEVADYLNENGVDEVAFNAIIKFAQDMMEDKDESADDNEEATEEPEEGEGKEEMRKGGKKFNKKVGEYIEFEYGGKTYKGTIKSIKNGQIFLK